MLTDQDLYPLFEKIFREHYDSLSNYAFSILRNKDDAEDVVQDVFIKVWQNTPQVIETPQIKYYLLTAVKNSCISFLRKAGRRVFVQPEDAHLHTLPNDVTIEKKKEKDINLLIHEGLALLPPQCAIVFKMSRFGKLTYQQIAGELDISVKTVENQVGKALRIMREFARKNNLSFSLLLVALLSYWV
jgi:RNA polymerase sigma-70 factor (ECF subfamily)